jgi:hypothetical protein
MLCFGQTQTVQPALNHIEYTPVAHSCAKETSQLGTGELWCNRNAEICVFTGPDPTCRIRIPIFQTTPETDPYSYSTSEPGERAHVHTGYFTPPW